ncbi:MAG: anhydro-N-acetylmuramic acid kinase, partial [Owenweeksia sp.]
GPELFARLGIPVVCNFRVQDVALGGQGAPLVPIGDELLFSDYDACLNLGGFANISSSRNGKRLAFDICPVNFILNPEARKLGKPFDDKGQVARQGKANPNLINALEKIPFYRQEPPKSLGAEWVNHEFLPVADSFSSEPPSLLSSFTHHIADCVASVLKQYAIKRTLVSGGGAYNTYLLELIRSKSNMELIVPEPGIIEFKEALVFALMGVLKLRNERNVLGSVTGARNDHSSGIVYH